MASPSAARKRRILNRLKDGTRQTKPGPNAPRPSRLRGMSQANRRSVLRMQLDKIADELSLPRDEIAQLFDAKDVLDFLEAYNPKEDIFARGMLRDDVVNFLREEMLNSRNQDYTSMKARLINAEKSAPQPTRPGQDLSADPDLAEEAIQGQIGEPAPEVAPELKQKPLGEGNVMGDPDLPPRSGESIGPSDKRSQARTASNEMLEGLRTNQETPPAGTRTIVRDPDNAITKPTGSILPEEIIRGEEQMLQGLLKQQDQGKIPLGERRYGPITGQEGSRVVEGPDGLGVLRGEEQVGGNLYSVDDGNMYIFQDENGALFRFDNPDADPVEISDLELRRMVYETGGKVEPQGQASLAELPLRAVGDPNSIEQLASQLPEFLDPTYKTLRLPDNINLQNLQQLIEQYDLLVEIDPDNALQIIARQFDGDADQANQAMRNASQVFDEITEARSRSRLLPRSEEAPITPQRRTPPSDAELQAANERLADNKQKKEDIEIILRNADTLIKADELNQLTDDMLIEFVESNRLSQIEFDESNPFSDLAYKLKNEGVSAGSIDTIRQVQLEAQPVLYELDKSIARDNLLFSGPDQPTDAEFLGNLSPGGRRFTPDNELIRIKQKTRFGGEETGFFTRAELEETLKALEVSDLPDAESTARDIRRQMGNVTTVSDQPNLPGDAAVPPRSTMPPILGNIKTSIREAFRSRQATPPPMFTRVLEDRSKTLRGMPTEADIADYNAAKAPLLEQNTPDAQRQLRELDQDFLSRFSRDADSLPPAQVAGEIQRRTLEGSGPATQEVLESELGLKDLSIYDQYQRINPFVDAPADLTPQESLARQAIQDQFGNDENSFSRAIEAIYVGNKNPELANQRLRVAGDIETAEARQQSVASKRPGLIMRLLGRSPEKVDRVSGKIGDKITGLKKEAADLNQPLLSVNDGLIERAAVSGGSGRGRARRAEAPIEGDSLPPFSKEEATKDIDYDPNPETATQADAPERISTFEDTDSVVRWNSIEADMDNAVPLDPTSPLYTDTAGQAEILSRLRTGTPLDNLPEDLKEAADSLGLRMEMPGDRSQQLRRLNEQDTPTGFELYELDDGRVFAKAQINLVTPNGARSPKKLTVGVPVYTKETRPVGLGKQVVYEVSPRGEAPRRMVRDGDKLEAARYEEAFKGTPFSPDFMDTSGGKVKGQASTTDNIRAGQKKKRKKVVAESDSATGAGSDETDISDTLTLEERAAAQDPEMLESLRTGKEPDTSSPVVEVESKKRTSSDEYLDEQNKTIARQAGEQGESIPEHRRDRDFDYSDPDEAPPRPRKVTSADRIRSAARKGLLPAVGAGIVLGTQTGMAPEGMSAYNGEVSPEDINTAQQLAALGAGETDALSRAERIRRLRGGRSGKLGPAAFGTYQNISP